MRIEKKRHPGKRQSSQRYSSSNIVQIEWVERLGSVEKVSGHKFLIPKGTGL